LPNGFKEDAAICYQLLDLAKRKALSNEESFEKFNLDKWSHVKGKDEASTKVLFSGGKSILQVHGCIQ
jgi:hypothetical protein